MPARANSTPKYTASSTRAAAVDDSRRSGSGSRRRRDPQTPRRARRGRLRAAAGRGSRAHRRSRRRACSAPRERTPSCRRARSAARRRRSRRPRRARAAAAKMPGSVCGRSRMCGCSTSVTRSRKPKSSASISRGLRTSRSCVVRQLQQPSADVVVRPSASRVRRGRLQRPAYAGAMSVGDLQVAAEERLARRPPADGQEVDDLDEQLRPSAAGSPHGVDERAQARDEAVVTDAQQRSARDVADAGRLDDDRAGLPLREALVPVEHVGGDEAVLGRAPRHHRRHPGAVGELQAAGSKRTEQPRRCRFCRLRPARRQQRDGGSVSGGCLHASGRLEELPGDDQALDLRRPFVDPQRAHLTVQTFDYSAALDTRARHESGRHDRRCAGPLRWRRALPSPIRG